MKMARLSMDNRHYPCSVGVIVRLRLASQCEGMAPATFPAGCLIC